MKYIQIQNIIRAIEDTRAAVLSLTEPGNNEVVAARLLGIAGKADEMEFSVRNLEFDMKEQKDEES